MVEPWGDDEIDVTRELDLECEEMNGEEYCGWNGTQTIDGFEYMGIEYFHWTCPLCKTTHTLEDDVR